MQQKRVLSKFSVTFLVFLMVLTAISMIIPMASAAGSISLNPQSAAVGSSVVVTGTGFAPNSAIAMGFGAEVAVANETYGHPGSGLGPFTVNFANKPIKPGTFVMNINVNDGLSIIIYTDNGAGGITSTSTSFSSGTIDYVAGKLTYYTTVDPTSYTVVRKANYTTYQYAVTPAANVTTSTSGSFSATITVPAVNVGIYTVTAIDTNGNRAVNSVEVAGWSKTYGGTGNDIGTGDTEQTSDGGYIVSGDTNSYGAGGTDFWLFKTDTNGNMQWNKTYGGTLDETCGDMCIASDGGFALAGNTRSFGVQGRDAFLVKTDSAGNLMWNKTYGGSGDEYMLNVILTSDNGYMMSGYTSSFGAGGNDAWLIKTDANGNMQWNKTYGGNSTDMGYDLVQTSDGGYTFVGYTSSFGAGGNDAWLVKTDANGNLVWNKTYGGNSTDQTYALARTSDGGYAIAGYTIRDTLYYAYLVRTDASGGILWEKTYRETNSTQYGLHMIKTSDEGFAIVGWSARDILLIKTDPAGNLMWNMTYGGSELDNGYALLQTSDGGYILTGTTSSFGAGGNDVWLAKVNMFGVLPEGFSFGLIVVLSSVAVFVSALFARRPPRVKNWR